MDQEIYTREELAQAAKISEEKIGSLEKEGLFSPSGLTAGEVPFYNQDKLKEISKVLQLLEMGYEPGEVKKIVERVGVPGAKRGRGSRGLYLTVGELSEKTGVGNRTIKHWEEKGIIAPDTRSGGGFRLYQNYYVMIIQLIKDLQLFGFKLEEIKEVADLYRLFISIKEGTSGLSEDETLERLDDMTEKTKSLKDYTDELKEGIRRWEKLLDEKRKEISRVKDKLRRTKDLNKRKSKKSGKAGKSSKGPAPEPSLKPAKAEKSGP